MSTTTKLEFDAHEAKRFLDALCGGDCSEESFAWQTFDDEKERKSKNRFDPLAETWSGPFSKETAAKLERLNNGRAGVFVTINRCDGRGRKTENVTAVRAP